MKTYLLPVILRRGSPVLVFAKKERSTSNKEKYLFMLGVYHELREDSPSPYTGDGSDYSSVSYFKISERLYKELLWETKRNQKKYEKEGEK